MTGIQTIRNAGNEAEYAIDRVGRSVRRLGWFSVGLAVAQLVAPRRVSKMVGVRPTSRNCLTMRMVGARKLLTGVGMLASHPSTRWRWARVAGDLLDITLLVRALGSAKKKGRGRIPVAIATVAGMTLIDVLTSRRLIRNGVNGKGQVPLITSITINRPPEEVYAFWRNFQNLPRFMTAVESVEVLDRRRSHWKLIGPAGKTLEWSATVAQERPNELIAWRTLEDSNLASEGEVRFIRAPAGRGTEVHLQVRMLGPGGAFGQTVGKLLRKAPEEVMHNDLRRLKQLLEVGEVVQSDASLHRGPHPARPALPSKRA